MSGFFATSFQDISGIEFVDVQNTRLPSINRKTNDVLNFIQSIPVGALSSAASSFFKLRQARHDDVKKAMDTMYVQAHTANSKVPTLSKVDYDAYDIGMYIRGNAKRTLLQPYITAIRAFKEKYKMEKVGIFLMLDDISVLEELKRSADASCTFYMMAPSAPSINARSNSSAAQIRLQQENRMNFLANISILQNIPYTVTTMGSAVGKFLFLTCSDIQKFKTIDTTNFSPIITL
jgi:hypothetical protein